MVYHRYWCVQHRAWTILGRDDRPAQGLTARPLTQADLDAAYAVYAAAEVEDAGRLAIEPGPRR